tara:strand:- start:30352 stop:30492 length:141 start_codon:yes stop_codon:yes gene_type:complete
MEQTERIQALESRIATLERIIHDMTAALNGGRKQLAIGQTSMKDWN